MNRHDEHHHDHPHGHDHDHSGAGHHHDHDHGHDPLHPDLEAELNLDDLDPAGKSLADALNVSFGVLKFVMIAMIIFYFFSGMTKVNEGTVAVRTAFGAVQGDRSRQVLEPGGPYLWWPEPVGQFIIVPTSVQTVTLDESFWFGVPPADRTKRLEEMEGDDLIPGRDGSLLTADRNIVHAQWEANYRITDPVKFIENVGFTNNAPADAMDERRYNFLPPAQRPLFGSRQMVRFAVERAIVQVAAQTMADEFVRSNVNRERIVRLAQEEMEQLGSGITISQVLLKQPTPPLKVRGAFQAVSQAESERAQMIDTARQEATQILNSTAGGAYRGLDLAINFYESARRSGDEQAIALGEKIINDLLDRVPPIEALQPLVNHPQVHPDALQQALSGGELGGAVAEEIAEAKRYRTEVVAEVRRQAETFQALLPQYMQNPRIFMERRWQTVRQDILAGDVETHYYPSSPNKIMEIEINKDPRIAKERERQRYSRQIGQQPQ